MVQFTKTTLNVIAVMKSGPMFLNALNTNRKIEGANYTVCILLKSIEVGPFNVVQVITNNATNFKSREAILEIHNPRII